jgi:uncharacterized protein (DUF169 family)
LSYSQIADSLVQDLNLARIPVGLAFVETPPANASPYPLRVPSACAFWKAAEEGLFYATGEDHYNCPIGAITQGFPIPQAVTEKAMSLIEQMGQVAYLEAAEADNVPKVRKAHKAVVYGPLKDFTEVDPDVALILCTPFQAMLLSEAGSIVSWTASAGSRMLGRPACAVIPTAIENGVTTVSLGCMGARTFAGIKEEELLVALPAPALAALGRRLAIIRDANSAMREYYKDQKRQFDST